MLTRAPTSRLRDISVTRPHRAGLAGAPPDAP